MITLRKLAAEVKRLESGGDPSADSQLSEAYIVLLIRQALNMLLHAKLFDRLNDEEPDRATPQLIIATYTVAVIGDSPNKYIVLPEFFHNQRFNKGLVIAPVEDPTAHFIQRQNPGVSRNLPCAELEEDQNSFWLKGKNAHFDEPFDLAMVLVDMPVAAPDYIGVDDGLPIYPEMEFQVIGAVRQMLANKPLQDKILDSNADIGVKIPG